MTGQSDHAADTADGAGETADSLDRAMWVKVGAGIGSAALLAALLYARNAKPKGKADGKR